MRASVSNGGLATKRKETVVGNDKDELRFWKLHSKVGELVREGRRDPKEAADVLQVVQDEEDFAARFFPVQPQAAATVVPQAATAVSLGTAEEQLARMAKLYQELFGFTFDPAEIRVPKAPAGFNRLIVASDELQPNRIVAGLRKKMGFETYGGDLGRETLRAAYIKRHKGTYAVWVRESQEADEDTKGRSANDLEREAVNCLTLEERLLYGGIYFVETGTHLDQKSWTRCAGSRYRFGSVPCVFWYAERGEVNVDWWNPYARDECVRARVAVS